MAALIGLALAIFLIVKKLSPVYSLMLGALAGGLLAGLPLEATVGQMFDGVRSITPAILRILAAGVLSGALIETGAAASIANGIAGSFGSRHIYLALALSTMLLCAAGVFVDVAVITVAPVALMLGRKLNAPRLKLLLAMIGGGKCGNIMSPNPNTIIAAENYGAPLSSVMAAGIIPALIGLAVTVYVLVPLLPFKTVDNEVEETEKDVNGDRLPSFIASVSGPLVAIFLLALRPLFGFVVDPLVALPAGGLVTILATGSWRRAGQCLSSGLAKMTPVAVLLVGTGTIAGVISASDMKDVVLGALDSWSIGALFIAPLSSILMSAATASTTAGATISSSSFSATVLEAGVDGVWAASMTNAGATVLDHLPHGSFFHATGGSVGAAFKDRLKLIPFESVIGLTLAALSLLLSVLFA